MIRAFLLVFATLLVAPSAIAQESVLAELYGRGVHQFYAGDYEQAYQLLTKAIENGSQDPRAYYFRGLVLDRTGRPEEAEADYRTGATLEARGNLNSLIGRSLARIQGAERLEIERIRQETRLETKMQQNARAQARYEQRQADEATVLRKPPQAAPTAPAMPDNGAAPQADAPAPQDLRSNPFADDGGTAGGQATVESDDALGDPLAEAKAAAEPKAANPAPAAAPADDTDDVFGGLGGEDDGGDIFGGAMDDASGEDSETPEDPFQF